MDIVNFVKLLGGVFVNQYPGRSLSWKRPPDSGGTMAELKKPQIMRPQVWTLVEYWIGSLQEAGCSDWSSWSRVFPGFSCAHAESRSSFFLDFRQNFITWLAKRRRVPNSQEQAYLPFCILSSSNHTLCSHRLFLWSLSVAQMSRKGKTHSPQESLGFSNQVFAGGATLLPIIVGPETLRCTLLQGLPFSPLFYWAFLSECVRLTFRTISLSIAKNGRIHNLLIF